MLSLLNWGFRSIRSWLAIVQDS